MSGGGALRVYCSREAHSSVVKGARIAAIVRSDGETALAVHDHMPVDVHYDQVIMAHDDTVVEAGDHVVVFCTRKRYVKEVEQLFQVAAGFF